MKLSHPSEAVFRIGNVLQTIGCPEVFVSYNAASGMCGLGNRYMIVSLCNSILVAAFRAVVTAIESKFGQNLVGIIILIYKYIVLAKILYLLIILFNLWLM